MRSICILKEQKRISDNALFGVQISSQLAKPNIKSLCAGPIIY